jgi:hypothetical protein
MRHIGFTIRSVLVSTVLVGSVAVAGIALAERGASTVASIEASIEASTEASPTAPAAALVEVPVCWGTPTTVPTLPSSDGAMVQTVTVSIEPTSLLRLGADGHVIAAETNTGCAPRSTDRRFIVHDDGSLTEVPGFDVASVAWTGDFTQFGFVPQG